MNKSSSLLPPPPPPSISHLPLKTRILISLLSWVGDFSFHPGGTINRCVFNLIDFHTRPNPNPIRGVSSFDITTVSDRNRNLWFRLFSPTTTTTTINTTLPVVIFFHGGGFVHLSESSIPYDAVYRRFALELPPFVLSVEYRLVPEHRFPCQYDDGFDVLRYLNQNPNVLPPNADLTKTFLAGDSTGANVAHHVAVRACQHEPKLDKLKLVGVVSIQPFLGGKERTDLEIPFERTPLISMERTDRTWNLFLPQGESRDYRAANVIGPNAVDISKPGDFPTVMVIISGLDMLRDRQVSYYEWLKMSGRRRF